MEKNNAIYRKWHSSLQRLGRRLDRSMTTTTTTTRAMLMLTTMTMTSTVLELFRFDNTDDVVAK